MTHFVKADGNVWINADVVTGVSLVQNGSVWEVRAGLTSSGQLIRTFANQALATSFVDDLLSELGLSSL